MSHYAFPETLHTLYQKCLTLYQSGQRDMTAYFTSNETAFLGTNGLTSQNLYDYVEDHVNYGEPSWNTALGIELIRRDYFINVQQGRASGRILDVSTMPAKTATIRGIDWLPRLIPKAKAKLRGELPASLMYNCGGDRRFFHQHDIHPAEFLSLVWRHEADEAAIIDWVVRRSGAATATP